MRKGSITSAAPTYPCALCGQPRCDTHAVWVPAHVVQKHTDAAEAVRKTLHTTPEKGWFVFCGRPSHIPRGMPIWYGKEKKGGKIVEAIFDHEKKEGLELFPMWEVGLIEEGFEKRWESEHYELSCELSPVMNLILQLHRKEGSSESFIESMHSMVFDTLAKKKGTLFPASKKNLLAGLGRMPTLKEIFSFVCSRCVVGACLNRQAPFYDSKVFARVIKNPETLTSF
ncbi:MAG: hypothetical protein ACFFAY_00675 [Promethearchaeota archaeon]